MQQNAVEQIQKRLFEMRDEEYLRFNSGLFRREDEFCMIGVRVPKLRAYARELHRSAQAEAFLEALPHRYMEENHLHAFLIERVRDYDQAMALTERFLPHIDNWATCDMFSLKQLMQRPEESRARIDHWLESPLAYTVRFGIDQLMRFYLDERFEAEMLRQVAQVPLQHEYVSLAKAWYFSVALVKQYDAAIEYFIHPVMETKTHNRAIQKAIESRRISGETKAYLRSLKI